MTSAAAIMCEEEEFSGGCLLVMFLNCFCRKAKQTAIISFMQCEMLIIDMSCFI